MIIIKKILTNEGGGKKTGAHKVTVTERREK